MEDVIIVGGGPIGFINALGLAQAGLRVTLIEAEAQIINSSMGSSAWESSKRLKGSAFANRTTPTS